MKEPETFKKLSCDPVTKLGILGPVEELHIGKMTLWVSMINLNQNKTFFFSSILFTRSLSQFPGLTICGHNCLLTAEWMSASKIVCRVGQAKNDKGDIIVTTKSGGRGTSTVSFKLLKPEKIGILSFFC